MLLRENRIVTCIKMGCFWLSGFFFHTPLFAQEDSSGLVYPKVTVKEYAATLHYGSIFAHSEIVQNTAGAHPRGIELSYTWQRRDKGVVDLCNCYPRQGVVVSYFDFDTEILGRGYMAGWMLEPTYRLGSRLQLGIKGIAGLTFMTNPFDSIKNPTNQSYSTDISAWLLVGLNFSYPISKNWRMQAGANFGHTSNGGMRQPNKGVNFPTASFGMLYAPEPATFYKGQRSQDKYWKGQPWRKDIAVFGTGKRSANADGIGTRQPILGFATVASKQIANTNAITVGAEVYSDGYSKSRMEADSIFNTSAVRAALMGGHEFLLGRFIFSQQLGVYVYKPAPYDKTWFHRWGLLYGINKHFWAGINLKAHAHVADFIDFRLVYSFN
jgi:hypothetical protein